MNQDRDASPAPGEARTECTASPTGKHSGAGYCEWCSEMMPDLEWVMLVDAPPPAPGTGEDAGFDFGRYVDFIREQRPDPDGTIEVDQEELLLALGLLRAALSAAERKGGGA